MEASHAIRRSIRLFQESCDAIGSTREMRLELAGAEKMYLDAMRKVLGVGDLRGIECSVGRVTKYPGYLRKRLLKYVDEIEGDCPEKAEALDEARAAVRELCRIAGQEEIRKAVSRQAEMLECS